MITDSQLAPEARLGWRKHATSALLLAAATAAILVIQSVSSARIDWWLPIETSEQAYTYATLIAFVSLWLQYCLIGWMVARGLNAVLAPTAGFSTARFTVFWAIVSLLLVHTLLPLELQRNGLLFVASGDSASMRTVWLASIYAEVVVYYVAFRFLLGAPRYARSEVRWLETWSVTTTAWSVAAFTALVLLKLFVDDVALKFLSYMPFIGPFWFIPNELSEHRYFVGQGTRIAAESLGAVLYAAFWMVAFFHAESRLSLRTAAEVSRSAKPGAAQNALPGDRTGNGSRVGFGHGSR
jgi:hypothetical protein